MVVTNELKEAVRMTARVALNTPASNTLSVNDQVNSQEGATNANYYHQGRR